MKWIAGFSGSEFSPIPKEGEGSERGIVHRLRPVPLPELRVTVPGDATVSGERKPRAETGQNQSNRTITRLPELLSQKKI